MCVECEDLVIEVHDPLHATGAKYDSAIGVLEKALGYTSAVEVTPYRSVRQFIKNQIDTVDTRILSLHNEIATYWLGVAKAQSLFKLNGKIVLNPQTGLPLTKKEWQTIKKDLMRSFAYVVSSAESDIAKTAITLGRIIADLPVDDAISVGINDMSNLIGEYGVRIEDTDPEYRAAIQFAEDSAAQRIVDLTNRQYTRFHDTVVAAQRNRLTPKQLERKLFQTFGEMNRDWRRIAETEIATNVNEAKLITEITRDKPEGTYPFVRGVSSPYACPWCRTQVHDKVAVVLPGPPNTGDDKFVVNDVEYTAVWPGKSNVGRNRRNWWLSAGTQHPHCQCTWSRYQPGFESYFDKLEAEMARAAQEARDNIRQYQLD